MKVSILNKKRHVLKKFKERKTKNEHSSSLRRALAILKITNFML
jgi:hypothetical protein